MKVVVTGIGCVVASGHDLDQILALKRPRTDTTMHRVNEDDLASWIPRKNLRKMDRLSKMTTAAVAMALTDADLLDDPRSDETGLILDTGFGSAGAVGKVLEGIFDDDPTISPLLFPNVVANASSGQAAMAFGLRGPSSTLGGIGGLMYAFDLIAAGRAERLVVGGCDEITDLFLLGLQATEIDRVAMQFGDGAAFVVIESEESGIRRGVRPYAELGDVSMYSDPDFQLRGNNAFAGGGLERAARDVVGADVDVTHFFGVGWPGTGVRSAEERLVTRFGIPSSVWAKDATGEMFASSNSLNAVLASTVLREATAPSTALVTGYDSTRGQSLAALFRSV